MMEGYQDTYIPDGRVSRSRTRFKTLPKMRAIVEAAQRNCQRLAILIESRSSIVNFDMPTAAKFSDWKRSQSRYRKGCDAWHMLEVCGSNHGW